jgi:hypothetical protein
VCFCSVCLFFWVCPSSLSLSLPTLPLSLFINFLPWASFFWFLVFCLTLIFLSPFLCFWLSFFLSQFYMPSINITVKRSLQNARAHTHTHTLIFLNQQVHVQAL